MTHTANESRCERQARSFTEPLTFVALLLPTFVVLAAAAVSLAGPDGTSAAAKPIATAAACEPYARPPQDGDEAP